MGNRVIKKVPVKQGLYEENVTQQGDIGAVMEFEDGRKYVYSLNGAAALEPGLIVEGPAESADDEAVAIVTGTDVAVGDKTISITTGRVYTANELKDGYLVVEDNGTGVIGHMRKIKSHPAAGSAETLVITVYDAFTDTAVGGTDSVNIIQTPYSGVIVCPTTHTGPILGVPPIHVTAAYYFWLQVAGVCSFITGAATVVVGDGLVVTGLAGTVKQAAGSSDEFVGWAMQSQDTSGNACIGMLCLGR